MKRRAATGGGDRRRGGRAREAAAASAAGLIFAGALLAVSLFVAGCAADVVTTTSAVGAPSTSTSAPVTTSSPPTSAPQEDTTSTTALPDVIKVGALFPLTGDLSAEGESALRGMRLAIEEINKAGGIASLGGLPLTLVEADSKGDPTTAVTEVARLAQEEHVAAIVGTGQSTVALDATDAAERLEVPFLVSSGAADEVTGRDLRFTFRLCPKADWYARDQVAFLGALNGLAGLQVSKVALLHEDGEYGKQTAESEKAYLEQAGIEVVEDIEYAADQADMSKELLQIKQSDAQAILTATFLGDAALIAQGAAVLHMSQPIIDAAGGALDPGFQASAGYASEGMMSVAEYAPDSEAGKTLGQKLSSQTSPPGPGGISGDTTSTAVDAGSAVDADLLYGYQAVWVLADALERGASVEGSRLSGALRTTALSGQHLVLPQDLLMFDKTGQNWMARLLVLQVQDGKMVTVWPTEYANAPVRLQ